VEFETEKFMLKKGRNPSVTVQIVDDDIVAKNGEEEVGRRRISLPRNSSTESSAAPSDVITNSIGMKLKLIPAGEFMMGSPVDEMGRAADEGPQHKVRITKPFYMSITEVTQAQWFAVLKTKPWEGEKYVKEGDAHAATYVSWEEAMEYCVKLSELEGIEYRLPTEAEWEYACRGGKSTAYSFGSDASGLKNYAWFDENANNIGEQYAHEVGVKQSNPFGLYDMHGNAWEWCQDVYDEKGYASRTGTTSDPLITAGSENRVLRGGSWSNYSRFQRSAGRNWGQPTDRKDFVGFGFRVIR